MHNGIGIGDMVVANAEIGEHEFDNHRNHKKYQKIFARSIAGRVKTIDNVLPGIDWYEIVWEEPSLTLWLRSWELTPCPQPCVMGD